MKITAIKQQVKKANRYSFYVDGKYSFSLSENDFVNYGLVSGQEITEQDLSKYKQASDDGKWLDRTLNLLSYRPRSEWEIRSYLKRKDCPEQIVDRTLNKLRVNKYLDDEQFAKRWVENRRLLKPVSRRKLSQELRAKRISSEILDRVLSDDKEITDEKSVLRELVAKKSNRYPDRVKFMQYLARQGFGYEDIKAVLNEEVAE
jgi:regulatory protein